MPLSHTLKNGSDGELYVIKDKKKGKNLREQKRGTTGNRHVRRVSWCGRRFKSQDPGGALSPQKHPERGEPAAGVGSKQGEREKLTGPALPSRASPALGRPCPGPTPPWPSSRGRETSSSSWQAWWRADKNQATKSAFEPSKAQKSQ